MKVIELLNKLEEGGQLAPLYKAGIITLSAYSFRDVFLRWQTLRASLRYESDNAGAVKQTAQEMGISTRTVYAAVRAMEQPVQFQ